MTARGIRNNNPGNIEYGRFTRRRGATGSDGRFARFQAPEQGIGAIYALQRAYENEGLSTVYQRISRWAPPGENDTLAYATAVANAMGIGINDPFSISDPRLGPAFVGAVIQHENGVNPYTPEQIAGAQSVLTTGEVRVAGGAPDAGSVPLPRISPTQRAMAQTQPAGTEAVAYTDDPLNATSPLAAVEAAAKMAGGTVGGVAPPGGAPANPPTPPARPQSEVRANPLEGVKGMAVASEAPSLNLEGPSAPASEGLNVRVRRGDTLWDLSSKYLGDGRRWTEIQAANNGVQPKSLLPGMVLKIPGVAGPPLPPARPVGGVAESPAAVPSVPASAPAESPARVVPGGTENAPAPAATPPAQTRGIEPPARRVPNDAERYEDSTMLSQFPEAYAMPQPATPTVSPTSVANSPPPVPAAPSRQVSDQVGSQEYDDLIKTMSERFGNVSWTPGGKAGEPVRAPLEPQQVAEPAAAPEPSWWEIGTGLIGDLLADKPAVAKPEQPGLNLESVPLAPSMPMKDQSRITPDLPSQKQPASRVSAPRDAVGGSERPATSGRDFLPINPAAFAGGKNPEGVSNVRLIPSGRGVTYEQSGYKVASLAGGIATRTPLTTASTTTTGPHGLETWNAATNSWVPAKPQGGSSITNQTQLTPVQQSNAGAALPGRPY